MYTLAVTASDTTSPTALTAVHTVVLTVANVDEAPTTTTLAPNVSLTVVEGMAANLGSVATWFSDPDAGDSLTFMGSLEKDGTPGVLPDWLVLNDATWALTIAAMATDDDEVGMYTLAVTASDTDVADDSDGHPYGGADRRERPRASDDDDACSGDGDGGRGCYGRLGCHDLVLGP